MKLLQSETSASPAAQAAAGELVEVIPLIMRHMRELVRRHRGGDLSVPQMRALSFVERYGPTSLTEVARHVGLALPSMSKLVDGLVERELVTREFNAQDRRRMMLTLTARGRALLQSARIATEAHLSDLLGDLQPHDIATIARAMRILRPVFASEQEKGMLSTRQPRGA